jgi:hypothetical protein
MQQGGLLDKVKSYQYFDVWAFAREIDVVVVGLGQVMAADGVDVWTADSSGWEAVSAASPAPASATGATHGAEGVWA